MVRRLFLSVAILAALAAGPARPAHLPIVVELFTSEGCSSCPPADAVLADLARSQPVPSAQVIVLGWHVTYWDQLGWKDAASLQAATDRQQGYGRAWNDDNLFTPQAVVDGRAAMVGSDEAGLVAAITREAGRPHATPALTARRDGPSVRVEGSVANVPAAITEPLEAVVVLVQDSMTTAVTKGENRGRTLHHVAVVRAVRSLGSVKPGAALQGTIGVPPAVSSPLRAVLLLQGRHSLRIYGAAEAPLG